MHNTHTHTPPCSLFEEALKSCSWNSCSTFVFVRFGQVRCHVILGDIATGAVAAGAPWPGSQGLGPEGQIVPSFSFTTLSTDIDAILARKDEASSPKTYKQAMLQAEHMLALRSRSCGCKRGLTWVICSMRERVEVPEQKVCWVGRPDLNQCEHWRLLRHCFVTRYSCHR